MTNDYYCLRVAEYMNSILTGIGNIAVALYKDASKNGVALPYGQTLTPDSFSEKPPHLTLYRNLDAYNLGAAYKAGNSWYRNFDTLTFKAKIGAFWDVNDVMVSASEIQSGMNQFLIAGYTNLGAPSQEMLGVIFFGPLDAPWTLTSTVASKGINLKVAVKPYGVSL